MTRKKKYQLILITLILGIFIGFAAAHISVGVAFFAKPDCVSQNTELIVCKLRNMSLKDVMYGTSFSVEYLSDEGWIEQNDTGVEINFELGAKTVFPFTSATITYPVYLFSALSQPGRYRIVANISADHINAFRYAEFQVS